MLKIKIKIQASYEKASIICPESEIESLGGCDDTSSDQLQAHLTRLKQRLQQESQRHQESIDELRMMHDKKQRKIIKQQKTYKAFRDKLSVTLFSPSIQFLYFTSFIF